MSGDDVSETSFEIGVNDSQWRRRSTGHSAAAWHAQLVGQADVPQEAELTDELRAPAPRARRPSEAPAVACVQSPFCNADGSSIRFDVEQSAGDHSRHRTTLGESSIEYEVLSPFSPPQRHGRQTPPSRGNSQKKKRLSIQGGAAQRSTAEKKLHHHSGDGLVGGYRHRDPLERLYHVGLDRKLAKQQWACLERARRHAQMDEMEGCTFQPQISPYAEAIERPRALSPQFRARDDMRRKVERIAQRQRELEEKQMTECTFKPLTLSAARLHASALLERSNLHEKLFKDHKKRQLFRDHLQMEAVKEIEERMLYRRDPSAERRYARNDDNSDSAYDENDGSAGGTRRGGGGYPRGTVSIEEVNAIVERLLHASIHHVDFDPQENGETFRPSINPMPQWMLDERRQQRKQQSTSPPSSERNVRNDNDEKPTQLHPPGSHAYEAHVGSQRSSAAFERRKHHAVALFNTLAQRTIDAERKKHTNEPPLLLDDAALGSCSFPLEPFQATAEVLLAPKIFDDVQRALWMHMTKTGGTRIGRDDFVRSLLVHTNFSSSDVHVRPNSNVKKPSQPKVPVQSEARTESAAERDKQHLAVVERLLKKQRNAQQRLQLQREEKREDEQRALAKQCTFEPQVHPRPATTRSQPGLPPRSVPEERQEPERAPSANSGALGKSRRVSTKSGAVELEHNVPLETELRLSPQPSPMHPTAGPTKPSVLSCCAAAAATGLLDHRCVSRDVISEHAAFGGSSALKAYGTKLMQRQFETQ